MRKNFGIICEGAKVFHKGKAFKGYGTVTSTVEVMVDGCKVFLAHVYWHSGKFNSVVPFSSLGVG